ncbi:hypothetical protein A2862_03270 [Candidatus Roizmanbacteria bacterium RIFCSPHIGHO2_01_FULL_38_41]|uniref:N-acetyltransferase domain-containing protein n=1 Tax=Candidatus Roizmanbacteria bacterium RIFCSPHIGHO2_02_FULL_37_24 TaxID=1802037 RepID=A0A1F7GUF7_9BACT|nr:MAG: hypothetical protein A2862_03270 [Candidatus Roizmanbacteria bacterium RIFCSPHIGHO2_01_FULL_38_41]OGK22455.1 MAG: hypothetical protein A3C24_03985 [Candidatus Roizmanbacteria bacterium RIFCSPHIGHO2_02_FULL_37_24]OGK33113.1 MAG: hypothetical protein A3E10_00905 [Candidatus Roizmanbacteria bacterium RIFCSPHIGHO2_12_FULL_37_23]OGK43438.1 MAG: hypothetical protein A2956_02525 [Candidatus Roizmanbacteria bacterium RIFCSPLOWO2_01_FULL_37_57]OGK61426.1 MAG: hypothetical protein A3G65_00220 [Ca
MIETPEPQIDALQQAAGTPIKDTPQQPLEVNSFTIPGEIKCRWNNIIPVAEQWTDQLQTTVAQLPEKNFNAAIQRRVVELVLSKSALEQLTPEQRDFINQHLESFGDLAGSGIPDLEDCVVMGLGRNSQARRVDVGEATAHFADVQAMMEAAAATSPLTQLSEPPEGVEIIPIGPDHPQFEEYLALIDKLGYDREDTENETCIVAVSNGRVVGSIMTIDDGFEASRGEQRFNVSRVEITGAYTLPEFRGQRIYSHLLKTMMTQLAHTGVNIVEGCTKDNIPILKAVAHSGRRITSPLAEAAGLRPHGLPNHAPDEHGNLVTHFMNFLPQQELRSMYLEPRDHLTTFAESGV